MPPASSSPSSPSGPLPPSPLSPSSLSPVGVHREWDRLAEVVVGRPLDFTFPPALPTGDRALGFLPAGFVGRAADLAGKRWSQADPDGFARCAAQLDALADFLTARGITVHRPVELTPDEQALFAEFSPISLQIFVRDPMIVVGDTVIESSLRLPHRFKERYGLRPLIADLVARGARHTVVPPGRAVPLDRVADARGPFLEGGDVMLFGPDLLVGVGEGRYATDPDGVDWLRTELGADYRVHAVPLHPRVLHLDDGLAAVREGLAIVARDQFTAGLPPLLADWDLVEVTLDDALDLLAANVLVLGPGELVLDTRLPRLAETLAAHNVTCHPLPFDAVTPFAGGFRCSHHPIRREPT
ncbi:dimethylarginine dimethylaminohydrolase family protein [Yinghuangia aomiensis]|uniref:Dimethylarginine dimethylaminohydrolase family protein n=1 Tax=Yinghuangia aomiensis TaxID=676205 RepID=A0ABP9IC32_9ACTN